MRGITDHLKIAAPTLEAARLRWRMLAPLVDRQLQHLALAIIRSYSRSTSGHSIEPGELVNEFYIRLLREGDRQWQNRNHFYSYAGAVMRTIMIDRHRAKVAQKRPPPAMRKSLGSVRSDEEPLEPDAAPMVELRLAMERLQQLSPRQAMIVEWRYFRGFGLEEIAARLQLSEKTVRRDWTAARAFLLSELGSPAPFEE